MDSMSSDSLGGAMPAPGRACGACMMCCKLLEITQLRKPAGKWCPHVARAGGCGIYNTRPDVCRSFHCEWMINASLGPEWKPEKCKFVMYSMPDGNMSVVVDTAHAGAWRDPRFYPDIKTNGARLADNIKMLTVYTGARMTVVLPDRDVELGILPKGHQVRLYVRQDAEGRTYDVRVEPVDSASDA